MQTKTVGRLKMATLKTRVMQPQAQAHQEQPEAGRGKDIILPLEPLERAWAYDTLTSASRTNQEQNVSFI